MRVVKGIYENGVVCLLEPVCLKDKQEVTVLVADEGKAISPDALRFAGMLRDLSTEETTAFDEVLRRKVQFGRKVQP